MTLENKQRALEGIGLGDQRSAGALVQSGKVLHLVDADFVGSSYSMDVNDQVVRVTISGAGTFLLVLPSVREAAGRFYTTFGIGVATGTLAVTDKADDANFTNEAITTGVGLLWYSDGYKWYLITQAIA
jgi:hypothetical protein